MRKNISFLQKNKGKIIIGIVICFTISLIIIALMGYFSVYKPYHRYDNQKFTIKMNPNKINYLINLAIKNKGEYNNKCNDFTDIKLKKEINSLKSKKSLPPKLLKATKCNELAKEIIMDGNTICKYNPDGQNTPPYQYLCMHSCNAQSCSTKTELTRCTTLDNWENIKSLQNENQSVYLSLSDSSPYTFISNTNITTVKIKPTSYSIDMHFANDSDFIRDTNYIVSFQSSNVQLEFIHIKDFKYVFFSPRNNINIDIKYFVILI